MFNSKVATKNNISHTLAISSNVFVLLRPHIGRPSFLTCSGEVTYLNSLSFTIFLVTFIIRHLSSSTGRLAFGMAWQCSNLKDVQFSAS